MKKKHFNRNKSPEYIRCNNCINVYQEDHGEFKCLLNHCNPFQNRDCQNFIEDENKVVVQTVKTRSKKN